MDQKYMIDVLEEILTELKGGIAITNADIEVTTNINDVITVEQSDETKLKAIAKLVAGTALVGKVSIDQVTPNANEVVLKSGTTQVTNTTWDKKGKPFVGTNNFTRPTDTDAYSAGDAINNSTSAPVVMEIDLSSYISAGDLIAITNLEILVNSKISGGLVNAWVAPSTFTATNDNSELVMPDATEQLGGIAIPTVNLFTSTLRSRMQSDNIFEVIKTVGTSLFVALQCAVGYVPGNGSRYDVFIKGVVLK